MGTRSSKINILQCPTDYDAVKFKKICTLFDKLDKDSNLGVSSDEIEHIAAHHIKNCIVRMNSHIITKRKALEVAKEQLSIEETGQHAKIKREFETKKQEQNSVHDTNIQLLQNKIRWYESLDKNGKSNAFMTAVMPSGEEHMDFWSFFDYMKTRSDDIKNITD